MGWGKTTVAQGDALSQEVSEADPEWPAGEREAWRLGRAAGIEEAAKVVDKFRSGGFVTFEEAAAAIRALNK